MQASTDYLVWKAQRQKMQEKMHCGKTLYLGAFDGKNVLVKDYTDVILAKDKRCFTPDGFLVMDNKCFLNSVYNRCNRWRERGHILELVCGSLGFGVETPRWFEFGDPAHATVVQYKEGRVGQWAWHVWLEDPSGKVYDVVHEEWLLIAALHGKTLSAGKYEVLDGLDKASLLSRGLQYIAAPGDTQRTLLQDARTVHMNFLRRLHLDLEW